jgi:hypothetical protein
VLPGALGVLFGYHMWRVRKDAGLARADRAGVLDAPSPAQKADTATKTYTLLGVARGTAPTIHPRTVMNADTTVNAIPDLTRRALIVTFGTIALLSIIAALVRSPLEAAANPMVTPNPAKAPWYFLWLQEIVTDTTIRIGGWTVNGAFIGGVILPGVLVGLLTIWPWLDRSPNAAAGVWFPTSRRTQNIVFLALTIAILALTFLGTFMRGPYWQLYWPWESWPEIPTRL